MTLQRQYLGLLEPKVAALSFASDSFQANQSEVLILRLWDHLLVFQTWLGLDGKHIPCDIFTNRPHFSSSRPSAIPWWFVGDKTPIVE